MDAIADHQDVGGGAFGSGDPKGSQGVCDDVRFGPTYSID
jgi:hypothetical protein